MTFDSRDISACISNTLWQAWRYNDDFIALYPDIAAVAEIFADHSISRQVDQDKLDFALGWLMDNYERITPNGPV